MKRVHLCDLRDGQLTDKDYYGSGGELLLSRSTMLTTVHLLALKRRGVTNLYVKESGDSEELDRLLNEGVGATSFLPFEDLEEQVFSVDEMKNIGFGEDGLLKLLDSWAVNEVEARIEKGIHGDKPNGSPLSAKLQDKGTSVRSECYKNKIVDNYIGSKEVLLSLLNKLHQGSKVDFGTIEKTTQVFIDHFIHDRNIVLNLSMIKPKAGDYVAHHSFNVALLSMAIATSLGYSEKQVWEVVMCGMLHDCGMFLVPREVLEKNGRYTKEELFEIHKHPVSGLHILEGVKRLPEAVLIGVYQSHERENGKGYPKLRKGRLIHNYAKIVQVADIFDALCSPRPFRKRYIPYKAIEMMLGMVRHGFISQTHTKGLLKFVSLFPVGSLVELNTGQFAKVIQSNGSSFAKPVVRILYDKGNRILPADQQKVENLADTISLRIVRAHGFDLPDFSYMDGF